MNRRTFLINAAAATAIATRAKELQAGKRKKKTVGIVGCGRMGQYYADVYRLLPDTELVAIAEWNDERRPVVGKRFGVSALYKDVNSMLREVVPDIVAVITPTKFMKQAVIASAEAGVKGVSTDKPIAARLSDADAMVDACAKNNVVFAGGNLQRAMWQVQHAARRLDAGEFGTRTGAAIHGFGGEISGGGCQHISVLRLFADAEVEEVIAWASSEEALQGETDAGLNINGRFRMSSGLECQVYGLTQTDGDKKNRSGVDLWTDDAMLSWNWGPPKIFQGTDANGNRKEIDPHYPPHPEPGVVKGAALGNSHYLVTSILSLLDAVETGSKLWVSGHDLRQALEVAIACKHSAQLGNRPVKLPLKDRSLSLHPRPYRWLGGDAIGNPQTAEEASETKS